MTNGGMANMAYQRPARRGDAFGSDGYTNTCPQSSAPSTTMSAPLKPTSSETIVAQKVRLSMLHERDSLLTENGSHSTTAAVSSVSLHASEPCAKALLCYPKLRICW